MEDDNPRHRNTVDTKSDDSSDDERKNAPRCQQINKVANGLATIMEQEKLHVS